MSDPSALVSASFAQAGSYAASATSALSGYLANLAGLNYSAPTVSVTWNAISPPSIPSLPAVPALPAVAFNAPSVPGAFGSTLPAIVIDDFTEVAPTLSIGAAPVPSYGAMPTIPDIAAVSLPAAPAIIDPTPPTLMALNTVTFGGVDLRATWLSNLETSLPTLTLVSPTPYSYTRGAAYSSSLLGALTTRLLDRISNGGTGLTPAVEQALWDRARSREMNSALANEQEILRSSEALGFHLPAGTTAMQLRQAQQATNDKVSELSRDIAVKQAELEQENLKQAIAEGVQLESKLVDYSFQLEQLTFESARVAASNAIEIYNAAVGYYRSLLEGYQAYAAGYRTVVEGQMALVDIYKAQLTAEQTKAQVNSVLVEQYRVSIEASRIQADIYRTQVEAAGTLVQIEKTKVEAAGEQVRAYTAQINAETSKVEAFKVGVQGQQALVDIYRTKSLAFSAKVGAQAEKARAELGAYNSAVEAKRLEWDGYRALVGAEQTRLNSLTSQSSLLVDGFKSAATAIEAQANTQARLWETQIKDYEAGQSITLSAAKMNTESFISTRQAQMDVSKVGAQVYAQLTSSAYAMVHAQAGVSGSASTSVGYNYNGEVSSDVAPLTVI